jgi:hypothetical protein
VTPEILATLLASDLIRPVRQTADGQITEYELTWLGRNLLQNSAPKTLFRKSELTK